jgi:electron transport complex protein RnfD
MKLMSTYAPHLREEDDVRKIMLDVLVALSPAVIGAAYFFGWYALFLCIAGAVIGELFDIFVMKYLRGIKNFVPDGSGAVTGLLLAMNVSTRLPFWAFLLGLVFALGIGKHVFGGLGQNIFNPALVGRAFLLISFPTYMTTWVVPGAGFWKSPADVVTAATPLALFKEHGVLTPYWDLFIGKVGGSLGETSALLLIIGFIYLLLRKRVKIFIPVSYIGTVLVFSSIAYLMNPRYGDPLFHLLSGGLMLGALFMATDMVTSPITAKGQVIFGIGCGVLTMAIRLFGAYPEGVSFSILFMNALVPLIDRYTRPRIFGEVKK